MKWIIARTYGNGKHMNKVYPMWFEYLSQAENMCEELNKTDMDGSNTDRWVPIPVFKYNGSVW